MAMKLTLLASAVTVIQAFTTPQQFFSASPDSSAISAFRADIRMPTTEPLVPYRAPGSTQDQFIGLQSRQLRERQLWITRYIDDNASNDIISSLLYLQNEGSNSRGLRMQPMKLYLNIPGANLRPALAIYDALAEIQADGCEVATTNIALCAGMGALIAGAGTKGQRYCLPNARYLLQKTGMDAAFQGQATDIALEVANVKKWNEKINGEIARVTGQSPARIEEDLRRDFYLSSEEAVRYGLIDEVLLPMSNKRQSLLVDLGSFQSGEDQKYQKENPSPSEQQQAQQNADTMRREDDDDEPKIAKG